MRIVLLIVGLLIVCITQADSFDELLNSIKQQTRAELLESRQRVKRFKQEKDNQAALLA